MVIGSDKTDENENQKVHETSEKGQEDQTAALPAEKEQNDAQTVVALQTTSFSWQEQGGGIYYFKRGKFDFSRPLTLKKQARRRISEEDWANYMRSEKRFQNSQEKSRLQQRACLTLKKLCLDKVHSYVEYQTKKRELAKMSADQSLKRKAGEGKCLFSLHLFCINTRHMPFSQWKCTPYISLCLSAMVRSFVSSRVTSKFPYVRLHIHINIYVRLHIAKYIYVRLHCCYREIAVKLPRSGEQEQQR